MKTLPLTGYGWSVTQDHYIHLYSESASSLRGLPRIGELRA